MTVPSYTEDLTDLTLAEEGTGWDESTDGSWDDQGPPAYQDQDYAYIQGSYSVTADTTKTGVGTLLWDYGSTFSVPTDGAMLIWLNFYNPNALDTYANGGLRAIIGSGLGTFWSWDVGGSNYGRYPYGGWQNFAVNDTITPDDTVNSYAGGSHQFVGGGCKVITGIGKGESFQVDAIRVGRCTAIFEYGETADYCTIAGFAAQNDNTSNRWGLIQAVPGGYLWKGRMSLGTASNAVDFRDSNRLIFIQDTPKVTANFNTIEIIHASSNVEMTGFQFICLDPSNTASKGRWITTNDATVDLDSCTFVDMATFTFDSNTTLTDCTFRRCAQITTGGCDMGESSVLASTVAVDTGALYCDTSYTDTYFDGMTFTMGGNSHHAIDFGTSVTSNLTLRNVAFSGFGSADDSDNSTVRFLATSGSLTLSLENCTVDGSAASESNFSVDDAAGIEVALSIDPVTVLVHCQDADGVDLVNVAVYLGARAKSAGTATTDTANKLVDTNATFEDDGVAIGDTAFNQTDGTSGIVTAVDSQTSLSLDSDAFPDGDENYRVGGPFPVEDTVTIVNSGTTATVTHTGHGMASNDYVYINGGDIPANEGVFQITYINANSYSYTMGSSPGSDPTGTIEATFVALWSLTDSDGDSTASRVYPKAQPVIGWARKSTSSPYYKQFDFNSTISTDNGLSLIAIMASDE